MIAARQKNTLLTERTEQRFADVVALEGQGLPISAMCRELGLARSTVRRFYRANDATELLGAPRAGRPRLVDEFFQYLHARFNYEQRSTSVLYEELRAMDYRGGYTTVRDYVRLLPPPTSPSSRRCSPNSAAIIWGSWIGRGQGG